MIQEVVLIVSQEDVENALKNALSEELSEALRRSHIHEDNGKTVFVLPRLPLFWANVDSPPSVGMDEEERGKQQIQIAAFTELGILYAVRSLYPRYQLVEVSDSAPCTVKGSKNHWRVTALIEVYSVPELDTDPDDEDFEDEEDW